MQDFFKGRFKSIRYAVKGFFLLISTEHAVISQIIIGLIMTGLGIYFQITKTEWLFQIFAIGLVISVEGINTAVEKICDFIHPDFHEKIGFIKDISAGAVTVAALTGIAIGLIIYIPYIL